MKIRSTGHALFNEYVGIASMKNSMRCGAICFLLVLGFASGVVAQSGPAAQGPGSAGPSAPGRSMSPTNAQDENQQAPTIKAETVAIPIRVVVRDRQGHTVRNLKKEDFDVYQDGRLEPISNFTAISGPANSAQAENGAPAAGTAPASSASATASTQAQPPAASERFVSLFFDDMHLQAKDLDYTTADADKYLASLPPGDHVAIVTATRQDQLGFTTDRGKLHDAIMKLQIHPAAAGRATAMPIGAGCPAMDYWEADAIVNQSGQAATSVLNAAMEDLWICSNTDPNSMPPQAATAVIVNTARAALAQADAQTEAVLERIEETVHSMSNLDGQRVIVLISPGFLYATHRSQLADIIDRAIRSDVVVNTIETRRGFNLVAMARAAQGGRGALNQGQSQDNLGAVESQAGSDSQKFLAEIADSTGGRLFVGSDDYGPAFSHLAGAPEFYYLLAYSPQDLQDDGKYHTLKVSLRTQSNFKVEARHGFYAPSRAETAEEAAKRGIDDALFSDEEEHSLPVKFETSVTRTSSGAQQVIVRADVDMSQLSLQRLDGVNQDTLIVAAVLFDKDGNYVDGIQKSSQMNLKDSTLEQLKKTGFYEEIDLNVNPGDYLVRVAARGSVDQNISAQTFRITVPN
jgi:VWFA-related protein